MKKEKKVWTLADKKFVIANILLTDKELAVLLNTSKLSLKTFRQRNNIRKPRGFKKDQFKAKQKNKNS